MEVAIISGQRRNVLVRRTDSSDDTQEFICDKAPLDFSDNAVTNRTLVAVLYLAQRDTDQSIKSVSLDHAPTKRCLEARFAEGVCEDDGEERAACWAALLSLIKPGSRKVLWGQSLLA